MQQKIKHIKLIFTAAIVLVCGFSLYSQELREELSVNSDSIITVGLSVISDSTKAVGEALDSTIINKQKTPQLTEAQKDSIKIAKNLFDEKLTAKDDSTMISEGVKLKNPTPPTKKSASKAAFLSAICPGAGQIYAGTQWWMAPIFWGGLGGTIVAVSYYNGYYNDFRNEYKYRISTGKVDKYPYFDNTSLVSQMQYSEQQRDIWTIATIGIYLLNILHANVAVQLSEFNADKNLRKTKKSSAVLALEPSFISSNIGGSQTFSTYQTPSLKVAIKF